MGSSSPAAWAKALCPPWAALFPSGLSSCSSEASWVCPKYRHHDPYAWSRVGGQTPCWVLPVWDLREETEAQRDKVTCLRPHSFPLTCHSSQFSCVSSLLFPSRKQGQLSHWAGVGVELELSRRPSQTRVDVGLKIEC